MQTIATFKAPAAHTRRRKVLSHFDDNDKNSPVAGVTPVPEQTNFHPGQPAAKPPKTSGALHAGS
ncbi:MAG: hypothetical protein LBF62_14895 [Tannerellaceae bacterium]|jgi:hypothetical protein|nr:hypothetical protein [Tannerellaceae bacterium]